MLAAVFCVGAIVWFVWNYAVVGIGALVIAAIMIIMAFIARKQQ